METDTVSEAPLPPVESPLDDGPHVVLGTGQVGRPVASLLVRSGADVRVVNRSGEVPAPLRGSVDAVRADLSEERAAIEACRDASVVYFCVQPPYDSWPELFPPLVDAALEAAARADARFVLADNLYAYGAQEGPLREDLPHEATSQKGRTRGEMADTVLEAHERGRVEATIGRASDFYGPGVVSSIVGERFFPPILDGGTVWFPGDPDAAHTYTYIHDFARALITLGARERAFGEIWHVPSPETLTTAEFAALAGDVAGTDPTVRSVPGWVLSAAGVVSSTAAQIADIQYQFREPFVASDRKFRSAFDLEPTSHRVALRRTIDWYESRR